MKHVAPILAFTLFAGSICAPSARADETEAPSAPAVGAPQGVAPSAPPQPAQRAIPKWEPTPKWAPTLKRPTSVRGYEEAKAELVQRLRHSEDEEREQIREDLDKLKDWFDEDTQRASQGAFIAGVVMLSVGGAAAVGGGLCLASGLYGGLSDETGATCGATLGTGLGLATIGLAAFVIGKPLEMRHVARTTASQTLAPSTHLLLAPGSVGLGGTF